MTRYDPDDPGKPASMDDLWDQLVEFKHETRERHRELRRQVDLGLCVILLGIMAVLCKLYF